ncbi:copper transporter complex subunit Ctr4 [Thecaphora frezii]
MSHDHSSMSGMSGMDMDSTSAECGMNMLGNWDTINVCVLTSSWHIRTSAQFVGTCVGVFLIVFLIETVRRWGREYDRYIFEQAEKRKRERRRMRKLVDQALVEETTSGEQRPPVAERIDRVFFGLPKSQTGRANRLGPAKFRPTTMQQAVRSLIYGIQFTGAYLVMLMAMTYNGYILIAIVLGGMFGHFFSTWDTVGGMASDEELDHNYTSGGRSTRMDEANGGRTAERGAKGGEVNDDISIEESSEGEVRSAGRRAVEYSSQAQGHAYGSGACCG